MPEHRVATAQDELTLVLRELNVVHGQMADGAVWIAVPGRPLVLHDLPAPGLARVRALVAAGPPGVLVADRLGAPHLAVLDEAGWCWWDRRGRVGIALRGDERQVLPVRPVPAVAAERADPLGRPSGRAVAWVLLQEPGRAWTVRAAAAAAGVSVGAASQTLRLLADAGMVEAGRARARPLFAAMRAAWRPVWHGLRADVAPAGGALDEVLALNLSSDRRAQPGWGVVGRHALAAYGGAVDLREQPLRLLVPDERALAWAVRTWGTGGGDGELEVAVAPTAVALRDRTPWGGASGVPWRLASALLVGLSLAATGEQRLLAAWAPSPGVLEKPPW